MIRRHADVVGGHDDDVVVTRRHRVCKAACELEHAKGNVEHLEVRRLARLVEQNALVDGKHLIVGTPVHMLGAVDCL